MLTIKVLIHIFNYFNEKFSSFFLIFPYLLKNTLTDVFILLLAYMFINYRKLHVCLRACMRACVHDCVKFVNCD